MNVCSGRRNVLTNPFRQEMGGIGHDYPRRRAASMPATLSHNPARRDADQVPEHSPLDDRQRPAPESAGARCGEAAAGNVHPNHAISADTAARLIALVLGINAATAIRAATRTEPQFPRRV